MIGWECPKCGSVFGPFVSCCYHCGPQTASSGTTNLGSPRHPDDLDADAVLWSVRTMLRVPEGESLTAWARMFMERLDRQSVEAG